MGASSSGCGESSTSGSMPACNSLRTTFCNISTCSAGKSGRYVHPHRAVFQRVHHRLFGQRLVVNAAILPFVAVRPAGWCVVRRTRSRRLHGSGFVPGKRRTPSMSASPSPKSVTGSAVGGGVVGSAVGGDAAGSGLSSSWVNCSSNTC